MFTEEMYEVLNLMIYLTDGTAYGEGIEMALVALAEFDEDEWLSMTQTERKDWLIGIIWSE